MKPSSRIALKFWTFKRPLLVYGAGIMIEGAEAEAIRLAEMMGVPVALTWGAIDLLPSDHPLRVGGFGTHGCRGPNFAVQKADWILAIGTRLDSKSTSTPVETFAPKAFVDVVDIDEAELRRLAGHRREIPINPIHMDLRDFLRELLDLLPQYFEVDRKPDYTAWKHRIKLWNFKYPPTVPSAIDVISNDAREGDIIVCDTGHTLAWMMQGFKFKKGQRLIHAWNNTPMGYGLPAAIGAAFAHPGKQVILVTGDGGLQMNIQEMATVAHHGLRIKIHLLNNLGHGMCRQTQAQWLGGTYPSTSPDGGLPCPDFRGIAYAYGVDLVEHPIDPNAKLEPQVRFGKPLEDGDPALGPDVLARELVVS